MHIYRFMHNQQVFYGLMDSPRADRAAVLAGDPFTGLERTGEIIAVERLLPPVTPPNILCLGLNYRKHADETGTTYPRDPVMFIKSTNALTGYGRPIVLPKAGPDEVDYEVELALVIGQEGKNIPEARALEYVLGYTCANDVSARDWQKRRQKKQWARGKSFDTFCPVGPCLVTRDSIPDPNNLALETRVNNEVLQKSNTRDMIFPVRRIISLLSQSFTLLPGTLILTGTPEGVGFTRTPPRFLQAGDVVTVAVQGIGELTNPVVRET